MARYTLDWSFGLRNVNTDKYMNFEVFRGCDVEAAKMKKKQIILLKPCADGSVNLLNWQGKFCRVDADGDFRPDGDDSTDDENKFVIEAQKDGTWAIKSQKYGWYVRGVVGKQPATLSSFEKELSPDALWKVHLAMHPQITLKNIKRRRYVSESNDTMTTRADNPFGPECTLNLIFDGGSGAYGLQSAATTKFLSTSGQMLAAMDETCKYYIEYAGDHIHFKSISTGRYITSLGADGLCKATKGGVGSAQADETFLMEDSYPQVCFKSVPSGKYLSMKGGVEVAANAVNPMTHGSSSSTSAVTTNETYQMESRTDGTWVFKTCQDKYLAQVDLSFSADGGDALGEAPANARFHVEFLDRNRVAIKAANGKYMKAKMNRQIHADGVDSSDEACQFVMTLTNRPTIALRGIHGFLKAAPSNQLQLFCNSSEPAFFGLSQGENGYVLEGWTTSEEANHGSTGARSADATVSMGAGVEEYHVELFQESRLAIKNLSNGKYLQTANNGWPSFSGTAVTKDTLWEY